MDRLVRPNFIVAGATKAGTTSLYEYLRAHPDIFMPSDPAHKEPQYFLHRGSIPASFEDYLALFREGHACRAIGEASTAYLWAPESPAWIRRELGAVKIVILLRNPAKRAFSLWAYMARKGWEGAATFEQALDLEAVRMNDPAFESSCLELAQDFYYFHTGLYSEPVKRYMDTFGRERVKVALFEDLACDPYGVCADIARFLDVDDRFKPSIRVHNAGRLPRSVTLQHAIQKVLQGVDTPLASASRVLPRPLRGRTLMKLKELNTRWGRRPAIARTAYRSLMERYRPDIGKLEELLGRDLSVWYGARF